MDGHGSIVYIHPSSTLYNQETLLEWIIFHDVTVTSKIYVRTVCPVRYEWVKDLLPRLHQIDAYELSSVAREEVTEEEITRWKHREDLKRQFDTQIRLSREREVLRAMERRGGEKNQPKKPHPPKNMKEKASHFGECLLLTVSLMPYVSIVLIKTGAC
ncbi:PREDICTED: probable ATP-dependent RNA helicase DHX40 [Lepidothrix coronata]|uniref:Probable ATP-dependent RNA helicase DHX40 n=1 Tax=Lepidothrix coronata TaxID=321398 RepID=A0A6J0JBS0_9PASS|nr:PREDICTED: probable ATP-dependent RNA helicase DHX40 [Lepidothrix coronata]